ncbi:polysaccharide pyruvyl transferase CsaB [Halonatronum saccharophilum]|uniref:polysaccharide pyruvyl transferase CsaB n=1 Tax=Halonatronum saccharophilum TaxID=150060 RepID=UPI00048957A1|nr:polysaccharide pyruvyl transferase CsaB [Halonatronum saccharophilum]
MKKVIISGYYGFDNAGDEAILASLSSNLKRADSNIDVVAISANPSKTEKIHGIKAVGRGDFKGLIREFKKADLLISGGGSLLQDVTSNRTIPYYLGVIALAKFFKMPVFFCGQGVGPVRGRINKRMIKRGLNGVKKITVRDEESKKLLEEIGVKQDIKVTADPVFILDGIGEERANAILKKEEIYLSHPVMGVSIRPWKDNSYLMKLALILDKVKERSNLDIILIPLHYPNDLKVSRYIKGIMNSDVQILEDYYQPREILGLIGRMDLFLGVRLHSLIFASLKRIPILGISYDPKIDSFLKRLDLDPFAEIDNLNVSDSIDKILKLWEKEEFIKEKINKKIKKLEGLAGDNIEISLRLLGDLYEK